MRHSKYLNKEFDNGWTCVNIFLAANYEGGTAHNAYRYQLCRPTSDGKAFKFMTVHGSTMNKINKGMLTAESVAENKVKSDLRINEILYKNR